jgi:DNA-directed RNA polymerase alpha subunit
VSTWTERDEERARTLARSKCRQCRGAGVVSSVDTINYSGYRELHTGARCASCDLLVEAIRAAIEQERERARVALIAPSSGDADDFADWRRHGMSVRAINALYRRGIQTYGALTNHTATELRRYPGLGLRLVQDIQLALSRAGRTLTPEHGPRRGAPLP